MTDPFIGAHGSAATSAANEDNLDELATLEFDAWQPEELAPVLAIVGLPAWNEEGALLVANLRLATAILSMSREEIVGDYRKRVTADADASWEAIFGLVDSLSSAAKRLRALAQVADVAAARQLAAAAALSTRNLAETG